MGVAVAAVQGRSRVKSERVPDSTALSSPPLCLPPRHSFFSFTPSSSSSPFYHVSPSEVLTPCWAAPEPLAWKLGEEAGVLRWILTVSEGVCAGKVKVIHCTNVFIRSQRRIIRLAINCGRAGRTCQHRHTHTHTDIAEDLSVCEGRREMKETEEEPWIGHACVSPINTGFSQATLNHQCWLYEH